MEFVTQASPPIMVGVDVGQRVDPTAIVVAEAFRIDRPSRRPDYRFETRHMERLPIGTSYPDVGDRISSVITKLEQKPVQSLRYAPPAIWLLIDATGVGRPVIDIIREKLTGSRAKVRAVTFTHGDTLTGDLRGQRYGEMRLGKAFLVSRLQALFQTERIRLPAGHAEAFAMTRELMDYEIKVTEDANDRYGAFKVGSHDDLVTALGLAVLQDPPGPGLWSA